MLAKSGGTQMRGSYFTLDGLEKITPHSVDKSLLFIFPSLILYVLITAVIWWLVVAMDQPCWVETQAEAWHSLSVGTLVRRLLMLGRGETTVQEKSRVVPEASSSLPRPHWQKAQCLDIDLLCISFSRIYKLCFAHYCIPSTRDNAV